MVPRNFAPTRRGYRAREGRGRRTRRRDARSLDRVDDSRVGRRVARAGVRRARAIPARTRSLSADFACQKRRSSHDFSSGTTTIYDVVDDGRAGSRQLLLAPAVVSARAVPPAPSLLAPGGRARRDSPRPRESLVPFRAPRRRRRHPARPSAARVPARDAESNNPGRDSRRRPRSSLALPSLGPTRDVPPREVWTRALPTRTLRRRAAPRRSSPTRPRRGRHERPHARPQRLRRRFPVALAPRDARARRPATERRVVVGTPPDALEAEARGRRPLARDRALAELVVDGRRRRGVTAAAVLRVVRPRRRRRRRRRRLERRRIRRSRRPRRGGS